MAGLSRPNLLVLDDLLRPIERARRALTDIESRLQNSDYDDVICQGLFILAVSHVETMLTDTLQYYLVCFPQKIDKQNVDVSKEDLLTHPFALLEIHVGRQLRSLGYESFQQIVQFFCQTLSLELEAQQISAPLCEIKATRNILLHNNLVANTTYLATAGQDRRAQKAGTELPVDQDYVASSIEKLALFVDQLTDSISSKYSGYTKLAAVRKLWAFTFDSQAMPFEDFWIVHGEKDHHWRLNRHYWESGAPSHSERTLLNIWRVHFGGMSTDLPGFSMDVFDEDNQLKVLFLLSVFRKFSIQPSSKP